MPMIGKIYMTEIEVRAKARYAHFTEETFRHAWKHYRAYPCYEWRRDARRALSHLRLARACQKWEAENGSA